MKIVFKVFLMLNLINSAVMASESFLSQDLVSDFAQFFHALEEKIKAPKKLEQRPETQIPQDAKMYLESLKDRSLSSVNTKNIAAELQKLGKEYQIQGGDVLRASLQDIDQQYCNPDDFVELLKILASFGEEYKSTAAKELIHVIKNPKIVGSSRYHALTAFLGFGENYESPALDEAVHIIKDDGFGPDDKLYTMMFLIEFWIEKYVTAVREKEEKNENDELGMSHVYWTNSRFMIARQLDKYVKNIYLSIANDKIFLPKVRFSAIDSAVGLKSEKNKIKKACSSILRSMNIKEEDRFFAAKKLTQLENTQDDLNELNSFFHAGVFSIFFLVIIPKLLGLI